MNLVLGLSTNDNLITIIDKTNYKSEEDNLLIYDGEFRYVDLISVDILVYHSMENDLDIKNVLFKKHTLQDIQKTYVEVKTDGYFTLIHLELPTKEYVNAAYDIEKYRMIYSDGKKFYVKYLGYEDELTVNDIVDLALNGYTVLNLVLNFKVFEQVSICFLKNNYISLLKESLNKSISTKSDDSFIKLKLLRCAIDVIEYSTFEHEEYETSRYINKFSNCNNLNSIGKYDFNTRNCLCKF